MCYSNAPLATGLWFQRIAVIATGELGSVENSLRHAAHLVQLTPIPFRKVMPSILDEDTFEALLEAGDFDTAARQLFAAPTTLFIETRSDDPSLRAVIGCAILKHPVDGAGNTAAAAILDAWTRWLFTLRLEFGSDLDDDPVPASPAPVPICKSACPGWS
jgi:hypothetical protein